MNKYLVVFGLTVVLAALVCAQETEVADVPTEPAAGTGGPGRKCGGGRGQGGEGRAERNMRGGQRKRGGGKGNHHKNKDGEEAAETPTDSE